MSKTTFISRTICFFSLFLAFAGKAQLSGVYTIDNTILASATNFTSFTAFATALNSGGVSGPVTVNVGATSGPYNEQVNFTQAAGVSSTNTITINGNGRTITFNATSATLRHTVMLTGADWMTFNNLIITGSNGTNALSCHLWSGANNNTFNNCVFNAPLTGTGTSLVPFSVSGTSVSATGSGLSGDNVTVNTCTTNGGYYGCVFYGATTAPFNLNNKIINSAVRDFYTTGIYNGYCQNTIIKNNIVERPTRTTVTSTECIYLTTGTMDALVDGNFIRNIFGGVVGSTSSCYGVYSTGDAVSGRENIISNNIIAQIISNGIIYGIYLNAAPYHNVFHNTLSLDDQTSTAGNTRAIYLTGASVNCQIKNNIASVTRTGSGIKYGLYYTAAANVNLVSDDNVIYVNATGGTSNFGWLVSDYSTLSAWQTGTGHDMNSFNDDPQFTNIIGLNFVPTNTVINNIADPVGIVIDFTNAGRNILMPDPGALEFFNSPCLGAPGAAAFTTPTLQLCPGTVLEFGINNVNTFTNSGYAFQWYASTVSILGPFTAIPGATLASHITSPINLNTFYNVVATCTLATGASTSVAQSVSIAPTVTNSVPYFESFETLVYNGLPNCSWSASDPGGMTITNTSNKSNNRVPRTGTNYATFESAGVPHAFYSNGIYLQPGITYSASLWYITDATGFNSWQNLTLAYGVAQTPNAMNTIASVSPVSPVLYTPLSNTFMVTSPGLYFLGVTATGGSGVSPFLTWDDLQVIIPCSLNSPNLVVSMSSATICSGQPANLSAVGADNYSWNTGATTSTITEYPLDDVVYTVTGSNTLTGCSTSISKTITVNPSPQVLAASIPPAICEGSTATLTAQSNGVNQYQWTGGAVQQQIQVSPLVTTPYAVIAINAFGCTQTATTLVTVNPKPSIIADASSEIICRGDMITLTGQGGSTYQWTADNNTIYAGNPINITPQSSAIYTVTGTDQNGCFNTFQLIIGVEDCVGLNEYVSSTGMSVFPNPSSGKFEISTKTDGVKNIDVFDVSLRLLATKQSSERKITLDLSELPAGIYQLNVRSANGIETAKLIKQ